MFLLVQIFVRIFSKIRIFGLLYGFIFKGDHFYRFYSLILLFCKLCECDAICCELCDDKYQKNLVTILSILFSDISERNNDYSDTLNFRGGRVGVVTFFVLKVPDYESALLIYLYMCVCVCVCVCVYIYEV